MSRTLAGTAQFLSMVNAPFTKALRRLSCAGLLLLGANSLSGCGPQEEVVQGSPVASSTGLVELRSPAFANKLKDPQTYVAEHSIKESICGSTTDFSRINDYHGSGWLSTEQAQINKGPVGQMVRPTDNWRYCSGTLISRDLFLTAGHCVDASSTSHAVSFNYENVANSTTLYSEKRYAITAVVEDSVGGLDYAIVRLAGNPGDTLGWTRIRTTPPSKLQPLTIIQHPNGRTKEIANGRVSDFAGDYMTYGNLDTEGGSSGSGILSDDGYIIGVHTNGGCTATSGTNSGVMLSKIAAVSSTTAAIAAAPQQFTYQGDVFVASSNGSSFVNSGYRARDWFCIGNEDCQSADFNGDGRADLVTFLKSTQPGIAEGDVYAIYSTGTDFVSAGKVHDWFCIGNEQCRVGDVNGDGRADLITFVKSTQPAAGEGDVYVALSTGMGFGPSVKMHDWFCLGNEDCHVADVNGDGRADLVTFIKSTRPGTAEGDVYVALSTGTGFGPGVKVQDWFCIGNEDCRLGDVNGDGRADLITFLKSTRTDARAGDVYVNLSNGTGFTPAGIWHSFFCIGNEQCAVADVNGDGRADLVALSRGMDGSVYVATSNGTSAFLGTGVKWNNLFCPGDQSCTLGDLNGDRRADLIAFARR